MVAGNSNPNHDVSTDITLRGRVIFDNQIKATLTADDDGKFIAIDVRTSDYEIDADELTALDKLAVRHPNAQTFLARIGAPATHRFGWAAGAKK